jgi:arginine decarboxylase
MTTLQMVRCIERLEGTGLADRLVLLHFHIGSQVTEIRRIKSAVREAARVYCKLRKMGIGIRYLDVGGGLGIDYDGSKTSSDASVNYTVQEYANDIVFHIKNVCEDEEIPPPAMVCESGRMLTAYHAMLVTDVRGAIAGIEPDLPEIDEGAHEVIRELQEVAQDITVKNYREYYHDAIEYRDRMFHLFNLGMLSLQDRARGESLFREIVKRTVRFARTAKFMAEEFVDLENRMHDKYICNFSVFQSLPDHWALDQLFPVVPIHRLDEHPNTHATLVDITCDSDGEVDRFIDLKDIKESLEVHHLQDGEPYYLAFMLIGAYQDTMGDLHNLFGKVHEAVVTIDGDGETVIGEIRSGDRARDTLESFGFGKAMLEDRIEESLRRKVDAGDLTEEEACSLLQDYLHRLDHYTYLD